eukprot:CAMPEP_0182555814 /NCGR_PEP_ID=MMETSP1324-20130603/277_1 /TAXON_ID=236786 /ORGANISM="Florenciella sp., Strain RCC1587" /LENGTH=156 /DNA_ID=CAMNT_0024767599 /DNA_START=95 /DNA_END=562 /DNA_ORIENTATION=+
MPTTTAPTIVSPALPAPLKMGEGESEEGAHQGTLRALPLAESFGTTPPAHTVSAGLLEDPFYDSLESLICEGWSSNDVSLIARMEAMSPRTVPLRGAPPQDEHEGGNQPADRDRPTDVTAARGCTLRREGFDETAAVEVCAGPLAPPSSPATAPPP